MRDGVPNEKFPLSHTAIFLNTIGEKVPLTFHRDAEGKLYALPSAIQTWQNAWLTRNLESLGKLYQITGDERYAHRVAIVLERYAQFFPHYLVKDFLTAKASGPGARGTQRSSYVPVSTGARGCAMAKLTRRNRANPRPRRNARRFRMAGRRAAGVGGAGR